jgi:hypothetical protein
VFKLYACNSDVPAWERVLNAVVSTLLKEVGIARCIFNVGFISTADGSKSLETPCRSLGLKQAFTDFDLRVLNAAMDPWAQRHPGKLLFRWDDGCQER